MVCWLREAGGRERMFATKDEWVDALFALGVTNPGRGGYVEDDGVILLVWGQD